MIWQFPLSHWKCTLVNKNPVFKNRQLYCKEAGLLGKKADSSSGAGNVQNESGVSCHTRKQGSFDMLLWLCRKDSGGSWKRLPLAKNGTWASVGIVTEVHWNLSNMLKSMNSKLYSEVIQWSPLEDKEQLILKTGWKGKNKSCDPSLVWTGPQGNPVVDKRAVLFTQVVQLLDEEGMIESEYHL